jgi:hypothetical protein
MSIGRHLERRFAVRHPDSPVTIYLPGRSNSTCATPDRKTGWANRFVRASIGRAPASGLSIPGQTIRHLMVAGAVFRDGCHLAQAPMRVRLSGLERLHSEILAGFPVLQ